jgi:serine/threonine protein kinase
VSPQSVGSVISDRYTVLAVLRPGPIEVLLAHDTWLDRRVVVKLAAGAEAAERLRGEAVATARVTHPNVSTLYDSWTVEQETFAVLRYHDGETLAERIARQGNIAVDEALIITRQLLAALEACHRCGVIHRDVTPSNVLICRDGLVVLLDLGIASVCGEASGTPAGQISGTPAYISPEQAQGLATTAASDLYSLGVTLYEMLVGRVPFVGRDSAETARLHVVQEPVPPRSLRPALAPALDRLVMRALNKHPADRWPSAAKMLADLNHCVQDHDRRTVTIPRASPAPGYVSLANRWRVASPVLRRLGVVGAVLAALVLTGFALRQVAIAYDGPGSRSSLTPTTVSTPGIFEQIIDGRRTATSTPAPTGTHTPDRAPRATPTATREVVPSRTPATPATATPKQTRIQETPVAGSITTTVPPLGTSRHLINASLRSGEAVRATIAVAGGKRDITLTVLSGDGATLFGPHVVVGDATFVWAVERRAPWTIILDNDGSLLSGKTVTLRYEVIGDGPP